MKELSIEEKARRYDEAIEKFDVILNLDIVKESGTIFADDVRKILPELIESKDEKIKKALISILKSDFEKDTTIFDISVGEIIDWLEKQKVIDVLDEEEREFADNVDSYRKEIDAAYQTGYNEGIKATLKNQGEQVYDENLSKLLNKVICMFINDPNIFYSERDEVSKKVIPYVERLEKQGCLMKALQIANGRIGELIEENYYLKENLEKQDKQKANTIVPRFEVGDWVINTITKEVEQVIELTDTEYICSGHLIISFTTDGLLKRWTIQDAKDGDVLVRDIYPDGKSICLFKEFTKPFSMTLYCSMNNKGQFLPYNNSDYYHRYDVTLCPATKEQRDLLFQKMHEAGYEWDAEKKELKKIEQNLAESEDERIKNGLVKLLNCIAMKEYEDTFCITKKEALAWLEKQEEDTYDYKRVNLDKFDEKIQEFSDILEDKPKPYWDGWYEAMEWIRTHGNPFEKQGKQKSAENEELTEFDKAVGVSIGTWNPKTPEQIQSVKAVSKKLLKLAKKQINDEQKVAWNKEDEEIHRKCICAMRTSACGFPEEEKFVEQVNNWLKSLKNRVQPKQDEQKLVEIPSFKIGETITDGISTFTIVDIVDGHYVADDGDKVSFYVVHRYYTIIQNRETQKPAEWSEEDEELRLACIKNLEQQAPLPTSIYTDCINWLKSLRPQNSVTDEELAQAKKDAYNDALDKIEYHSGEPTFDDGWSAAIWYLKKRNAQPQLQWKPSDEQMEALWNVYCGGKEQAELATLYNDLKKLREV